MAFLNSQMSYGRPVPGMPPGMVTQAAQTKKPSIPPTPKPPQANAGMGPQPRPGTPQMGAPAATSGFMRGEWDNVPKPAVNNSPQYQAQQDALRQQNAQAAGTAGRFGQPVTTGAPQQAPPQMGAPATGMATTPYGGGGNGGGTSMDYAMQRAQGFNQGAPGQISYVGGMTPPQMQQQGSPGGTVSSYQAPQQASPMQGYSGQPTISTGPIYTQEQQNQLINQALGANAMQADTANQNMMTRLGSSGFAAAGSPKSMALENQIRAAQMGADNQARTGIPLQLAGQNAQHLLATQNAAENQYANRQNERLTGQGQNLGFLSNLLGNILTY